MKRLAILAVATLLVPMGTTAHAAPLTAFGSTDLPARSLSCAAGERMTGAVLRYGHWLAHVQVMCTAFDASNRPVGAARTSEKLGGPGGDATVVASCPTGGWVVGGDANSIRGLTLANHPMRNYVARVRLSCMEANGRVTELAETAPQPGYPLMAQRASCAAGQAATGVNIHANSEWIAGLALVCETRPGVGAAMLPPQPITALGHTPRTAYVIPEIPAPTTITPQMRTAMALPAAVLCKPGTLVEANDGGYYSRPATVIAPGMLENGFCRLKYTFSKDAGLAQVASLRPMSERVRQQMLADEAAVRTASQTVAAARDRFTDWRPTPLCSTERAIDGFVGGADTAREVMNFCTLNGGVEAKRKAWNAAALKGPFNYDFAALRFEWESRLAGAAAGEAAAADTRRIVAEQRAREMRENAGNVYSGGLGLNTTPNYDRTMSSPGGGSPVTGAKSEVTIQREMRSNACMANAARC